MPKCDLCGREFKSMAALGSHKAYTHKVGGKAETTEIENEPEIVDLKKQVRRGELSLRLQRLKEGMDSGQGNLLFLELDRLGREVEKLKKDNEELRAIVPKPESLDSMRGMISHLFTGFGDLSKWVIEHNKLLGQSMVLEGWRLTSNNSGIYNLQGLGDQRIRYLVKEGKIKLGQPLTPYGY